MDELSPEQLEVLGACCELQLGRQLLAACAEGDQASSLALSLAVTLAFLALILAVTLALTLL